MIFLCRENKFSFPSTREFCLRVWSFILLFLNRCTTSLLQILIKTFHDCILMLPKKLHTSVVLLKVFIVILFCFLFSFTYFQISDKIHFLKKNQKCWAVLSLGSQFYSSASGKFETAKLYMKPIMTHIFLFLKIPVFYFFCTLDCFLILNQWLPPNRYLYYK